MRTADQLEALIDTMSKNICEKLGSELEVQAILVLAEEKLDRDIRNLVGSYIDDLPVYELLVFVGLLKKRIDAQRRTPAKGQKKH